MQQTASNQAKVPTIITPDDLIKKLMSYALERKVALQQYGASYSISQKLEAVSEIIDMLETASKCKTPKACIMLVRRTHLNFHFIAPTSERKKFITWYNKIEECMIACREFLGWQSQNLPN